jgi:hypothetical protein
MLENEWEERFDVLYNNVTSNQAPGLNTYEKDIFLTKAQDEVIKDYFNPKGNKYGEGFDGNQKRQIDFSMITETYTTPSASSFSTALFDGRDNSKSVELPEDIMMIVNEKVIVTRGTSNIGLTVKALSYEDYDLLMSKPFKRPLNYQAWRLINFNTKNKADLIVGPTDTITSYSVRYVKRPKPIITSDLDGLTIDGYTYGTGEHQTKGCGLDPILHEEILQRAVELAKIAWEGNTQMTIQAGQRSE